MKYMISNMKYMISDMKYMISDMKYMDATHGNATDAQCMNVRSEPGACDCLCAVLAVVPTLLKEDEHGSTTPPTDDLAASLSG